MNPKEFALLSSLLRVHTGVSLISLARYHAAARFAKTNGPATASDRYTASGQINTHPSAEENPSPIPKPLLFSHHNFPRSQGSIFLGRDRVFCSSLLCSWFWGHQLGTRCAQPPRRGTLVIFSSPLDFPEGSAPQPPHTVEQLCLLKPPPKICLRVHGSAQSWQPLQKILFVGKIVNFPENEAEKLLGFTLIDF